VADVFGRWSQFKAQASHGAGHSSGQRSLQVMGLVTGFTALG
jgi:hypothetical protein